METNLKPFGSFIAFAVAIAALAGVFSFSAPAEAQDQTYVDLSVEITVGSNFVFTARNEGTADAYGVTVDIELADQIIYGVGAGFTQKSGTTCSGNIPGTTCTSGVWTVGKLEAGGEIDIDILPQLVSGLPCCPGASNSWPTPARAVIKNTVPEEEERFKGNNTAVGWVYVNTLRFQTEHAEGRYRLEASVDDLLPDAGDTVRFKFRVDAEAETGKFIHDAKVRLRLDNGMGIPTATPFSSTDTFGAVHGLERTWDWVLDTIADGTTMELSTTLDNPLPAGVAPSDLCLTAELMARPDNLGSRPTSAKICLREDPITLFETGEADLLGLHSCVGVTTYPCSSADTLELVFHGRDAAEAAGVLGRASAKAIMDPEKVVIQIKDPDGRGQASNSAVWRSGSKETDHGAAGIIPGVVASLDFPSDFNQNTFSITDSTTGGKPGTVRIISAADTDIVVLDIESQTSFGPLDLSGRFPIFWEFGELGTYEMDITLGATHVSSSTKYSDTSTLTFHVGPVAELEVRDGGASPHVAADRSSLTIVASNNGPDDSPGARVTGLPTDAEVLHISQGSYDASTGVWDIGELKQPGYFRAAGLRNPSLVLGATADATASVTIENSVDYEVCIDSIGNDVDLSSPSRTACTATTGNTWHTTPVYDYIVGNNTAKITAVKGTGGVGPGIPGSPSTQSGTTGVTWDPVVSLYGVPVECYQVQGLDTDWTTLANCVTGNQYVDDEPAGRRGYRVRAINIAGVAGPWSPSSAQVRDPGQEEAGLAGPPLNLWTQADGNNAIDVFWDPPEDSGDSDITGYTVQWSADGSEDSWNNAGSTSASVRTLKQRGLQIGAVRYYRVAARNNSGLGPWSYQARGQSEVGVPDAPTLQARALSDYEIDLTWNEPRDNGKAITGYRIEFSDDGSAESWSRLTELGAGSLAYTDTALSSNTRRYYRVRAVNSAGNGPWSRAVSATTHTAPPDAPSLTGAEADGPNAIVVTWDEPYIYDRVAITQYEVQWARNPSAETWSYSRKFSASTRSWRHTGLQPGETWHYRARASNGGNRWGYWSNVQQATTASESVPSTEPGGLTAQYDSASRSVTLTWRALSGQAEITGYDLQYNEDNSQWRDLTTTGPDDLTYTDAGSHLYSGALILYRVRGVTAEGEGPWSRSVRVSVPPDPPDAPRVMWIESDGSNHIVLDWEPPHHDGGANITGYRLLWCRVLDDPGVENPCAVAPDDQSDPLADPPGYSAISLGASARSYTHSVSPGYNYYYLLRATNGGNRWSEWRENEIRYAIAYAGSPAAPSLTARALDANRIRLTWTRPNDYGSEINNYWLYVYREDEKLYDWDNILDIVTVHGDETEYILDGLSPGTTRYFRIRAVSGNGQGKYSALRQATTPESPQAQSQALNDAVLPHSRPQPQQRGRPVRAEAGRNARGLRRRAAWREQLL